MNKTNLAIIASLLVCLTAGCSLLPSGKQENSSVTNSNASPLATRQMSGNETGGVVETSKGENLLGLAAGAFFAKQPKSERAFDNRPINLIYGGMMWRSEQDQLTDNVFVIETPGVTTLKRLGFDTTHAFATPDENARDILVEASNTSADSGFRTILETSLPKDKTEHSFAVTEEIPARWFRLTVKNNHGSTDATALARITGFGSQAVQNVPQGLGGTYRPVDPETDKPESSEGDKDIFLKQEGSSLSGCWRSSGNFRGGLEGTVGKVDWTQPSLGDNSGLMIFTGKNNRLIFWRLKEKSFWALEEFERVDTKIGDCAEIPGFKQDGTAKSSIADDLSKKGRTALYGINFDFNSDKLRDDSKAVLTSVVQVLEQNPDWKISIEGHTDSIGGEAFNQTLSEKRAASVKAYLVSNGIDESRLSSKGLGLSVPVESNDTEFGRAKNRRVELVK